MNFCQKMSAMQVLLIATTAAIATGMVVKQQCRYQNTTSIPVRSERILFSVLNINTNTIQILIPAKVSDSGQENPTLLTYEIHVLPMHHDETIG